MENYFDKKLMADIQEVEAFEEQQTYTDVMKKLEEIREKNRQADLEEESTPKERNDEAEFENRLFEGVITSGNPTGELKKSACVFEEEY